MQAPPSPFPRPPPKKGLPGVAVALIAVGCLGALGLAALFAAGVAVGFQREIARSKAAKMDRLADALAEHYTTTNGLLTAHYPSDFAAKNLDDSTLLVSRNLGGGDDEALTLAAVRKAITDDPHELARLLWASHEKRVTTKGGTSTRTGDRAAKCLGKYDGVEWEGTFTMPPGKTFLSKGCFFIHGEHGYELRYDVPSARSAEDAPLLARIVEATELAP
jgi:hypothetical protein